MFNDFLLSTFSSAIIVPLYVFIKDSKFSTFSQTRASKNKGIYFSTFLGLSECGRSTTTTQKILRPTKNSS
uniref:Uncharacterized protein n=1 Tax=Vibrio tasmaniensis TaxID=212663 RepID=A0A0H3ZPW5_9VIBR|nr:hypothetical protein [Vibrio tasmaniensis]AKN38546.1 hypothetical protein [Vibrio tasmaniensis]